MKRRYLVGVPLPTFLLAHRVRSSTISTSNIFLFIIRTLYNVYCKATCFSQSFFSNFAPESYKMS